MGEGERLAKKIYALAYHRASAEIVRRHEEEFQKELEFQKTSIRIEYDMFGEIETTRNPRKHGEADGVCKYCGQEWPCKQEKNRLGKVQREEAAARQSARSSTSGSS